MPNDSQPPSVGESVVYFESLDVGGRRMGRAVMESCKHSLAAIASSRPGRWCLVVNLADPQGAWAQRIAKEAGIEVRPTGAAEADEWRCVADARLVLFASGGHDPPASLKPSAGIWMAVEASHGHRWEADQTGQWQPPGWLDQVLAAAGTSITDSVETILEKADALADETAPNTRGAEKMLVLLEGFCVVLPVLWLMRGPLGLHPLWAGIGGLISPLLVVSFCWWLRWRGMGRLWARSRLVAEACRSLVSTRHAPEQPVIRLLGVLPSLRPLLQKFAAEPRSALPDWRHVYAHDRLDIQHSYYAGQRDQALRERKSLSRWSTLLMDVALAVGFAGMILTLHPRSAGWLDSFGGTWLDLVLGTAGLALPLGLLILQSLRQVNDSTTRAARYTQQMLLLDELRSRLPSAEGQAALDILQEVEVVLLSGVLEWYFQTETSEDFYTIREPRAVTVTEGHLVHPPARHGILWSVVKGFGMATGFFVRVFLGRLIWVVMTAAVVVIWISLRQTSTPEHYSTLRELGRLLNPADGSLFKEQKIAADHGTLVVAHGMWDGWEPMHNGVEHWTAAVCSRVRERLGPVAPQMLVLDWHEGARPSRYYDLNATDELTGILADVGGVKTVAQATGDFFGSRLARLVEEGMIHRDRPLHLIAHSAGGFVVARAVHILSAMGFPKENLHVTILDTPDPDDEITANLANYSDAEFYRTSDLVRVPTLNARLHFQYIHPPPRIMGYRPTHAYAWEWYRDTIANAMPGEEGFGRSPFCHLK